MPMRLSGLMSGMDTESIIEQLVMAKRTKVDDARKAQTKLQWTQDAWKTLNTKIKKFYDGALSNFRFESSFMKKTTKVSNSNVVSVITGENAMNTVQSLKVKQLAQPAYLTGGQVGKGEDKGKLGLTSDSMLSELGYDFADQGAITVTVGGEEKEITVTGATTIGELVQSFRDAGLNASFDATNQRFYIASKGTGLENDFSITAGYNTGLSMLKDLGLYYMDNSYKSKLEKLVGMTEEEKTKFVEDKINELKKQDGFVEGSEDELRENLQTELEYEIKRAKTQLDDFAAVGAVKNDAADAVIELNGVEYTSSRNTFEINGLTLTVSATTAENETVTLTTQDDTDGIYDMIKNFIKEYNELINEMDKLYNADSSRGYEPLTNEEKEAMSDREIEEWEAKIKDSLLRRDDTLGMVSSALKQMMISGIMVNGKQMFLSNFGIETLSYFTAAENEKNAFHIDGDSDDAYTSNNADKLKAMIASDPQTVIDFFVGLSRNMYSELTERMAKTDYSSSYTIYEDVRMKQEYDSYTQKIKELESKLSDYEDKWYSKFAKMETALSKLQSNVSAVTALLGG